MKETKSYFDSIPLLREADLIDRDELEKKVRSIYDKALDAYIDIVDHAKKLGVKETGIYKETIFKDWVMDAYPILKLYGGATVLNHTSKTVASMIKDFRKQLMFISRRIVSMDDSSFRIKVANTFPVDRVAEVLQINPNRVHEQKESYLYQLNEKDYETFNFVFTSTDGTDTDSMLKHITVPEISELIKDELNVTDKEEILKMSNERFLQLGFYIFLQSHDEKHYLRTYNEYLLRITFKQAFAEYKKQLKSNKS